jgi:hypothetical protein
LIQRFHLEDPVDQVCYQIGNHIQRRLDVSESLAKLRQSPFSAESSAKALHHLYLELRESTT